MEKVLFDPGYSSCVLGVSDSIEFVYEAFISSALPLKQKKFQFSILYPKFKNMILQNVSFYLGCLLWAVYLKSKNNAEIENNPCLDTEYNEETAVEETEFLINLIDEKLAKDVKYYINKTYEKDERYLKILNTYNEFIKLNKGFIETKMTDDIILPSCIKKCDENDVLKIKEKVDETISEKKLSKLFDVYDLILE